jgi:ATP-binding cassette subfamily B protein
MGDRLRALRLLARYTFRADPLRATVGAFITLAVQAFDLAGAVLLAWLTAAADRGDERAVVVIAVVLALTFWMDATAHWARTSVEMTLRERATLYFDTRMASLAAGVFTLEPHERPEYLDHLEVLHRNHQRLAAAQDSIVAFLGTAFRLTGTIVLLATVHPLLLLLPAFGLPSLWATARSERWRQASQDRLAYRRRLDLRLFQAVTSRDAGKEIRVFGLRDGLLDRFDKAVDEADHLEDAIERRVALVRATGWLSFGIGFVAALLLVAALAADGRADAAQVVLVILLASQVNWGVQGLAGTVSWLVENLAIGRRLVWLEDFAAHARERSEPHDRVPVPTRVTDGIRLERVSFRYPGSDGESETLVDVDLHLPAGTTVALVGDNGAGKTTLVKLLCRFYDPTEGRVTVDGVDLRRFSVTEWRGAAVGRVPGLCPARAGRPRGGGRGRSGPR